MDHELSGTDANGADAVDANADLETVLAAWHDATVRLEHTHEALRSEVRRLTDELEIKNRELARKNRLADLGQIASHVAHEVRNSLVPVTLYLSLLKRRISDDSGAVDIVNKISTGFTTLDAMVNDLLHFTAERAPQRDLVQVRELVEDICQSLAPQLEAQGIQTEIDVPAGAAVLADRDMLRRAVLNLTLNAVDAMPDGGRLVITAVECPHTFELEVADSGEGLSDEVSRRAFEPFFTTKNSGTGLGLAIVDHILRLHGGSVLAQNCPDSGAAFTLQFPSHEPSVAGSLREPTRREEAKAA
jgi:signal transduction histidine kinase